jgi:hypothetical protein
LIFSRQLADIGNKGKLNMAEFHVAMGLIFRSELYLRRKMLWHIKKIRLQD